MTDYCDCTNGNTANGWHESRGPVCGKRELDAWTTAIERVMSEQVGDE